jgi:hypothetical protein
MHPSKKTKMQTLLNNMKKFLETLGLPHDKNQCVNEFWSNLFHTYLEYVGVDHLYKVQPLQTENYCSSPLHSSVRGDYSSPRILLLSLILPYDSLTLPYDSLTLWIPSLTLPYSSVREGYGSDHQSEIILLMRGIGIYLQEN